MPIELNRKPRPAEQALLVVLGIALTSACTTAARPTVPRPFELWRGGDDGLTLRFADALETALGASPLFVGSRGKQPRTLIVTIPNHLDWEDHGDRTRVACTVRFPDRLDKPVGDVRGSCWEDELHDCVAQVVRAAERASRDMQ